MSLAAGFRSGHQAGAGRCKSRRGRPMTEKATVTHFNRIACDNSKPHRRVSRLEPRRCYTVRRPPDHWSSPSRLTGHRQLQSVTRVRAWRWLQRRDWTWVIPPTTPTAATRFSWQRDWGGRSIAERQHHLHDCDLQHGHHPQQQNRGNTRSNTWTGPAVTWRLGDYEPGQPLFRLYREISQFIPVVSVDPWVQSGTGIAPPSPTAAASLLRR